MRSHPLTRLAPLVLRLAGPSLAARLLPGWVMLAFAVTQLDAMIDREALRTSAGALPPTMAASLFVAIGLLFAVDARRAVTAMLAQAIPPWLARQPLPAAWLGLAITPLASFAALPAVLAWRLRPSPWPLLDALGAALVLAPLMIAVPSRSAASPVAAALVGIWALATHAHPELTSLWTGAAVIASPTLLGRLLARRVERARGVWSLPRPGGPLRALLQHDLTALARVAPVTLWTCALLALPAGLAQAAARFNGAYAPDTLSCTGAWWVLAVSPMPLHALSRLERAVHRHLLPPTWPISSALRAASLALLVALLATPTAAATSLVGGGGLEGQLRLAATLATVATLGTWFVVAPSRANQRDGALGAWFACLLPLFGVAALPRPWSLITLVAAAALGVVGLDRAMRARVGR